MRAFWFIIGMLSLILGLAGILLPLLPTVPFLLLAAFCFARSSQRVHSWLIGHPRLGPPITDWQERGAIGPRAKRLASLSIGLAFALSVAMGVRPQILGIQAAVLVAVTIFIWTRPSA